MPPLWLYGRLIRTETAVPVLMELLKDKDKDVRLAAAEILGRSVPKPRPPSDSSTSCSRMTIPTFDVTPLWPCG